MSLNSLDEASNAVWQLHHHPVAQLRTMECLFPYEVLTLYQVPTSNTIALTAWTLHSYKTTQ